MLELNFIRKNKDKVIRGLQVRNYTDEELIIIDELVALDDARKAAQTEMDNNLAEVKKLSKEIGGLFQNGKQDEAGVLRAKVGALKGSTKTL